MKSKDLDLGPQKCLSLGSLVEMHSLDKSKDLFVWKEQSEILE